MCSRSVFLAATLAMAPFGAKSADLVVWWEKGFNPEEDAAVREIIAAFEQETGKQVDLEQRRKATLRPRPLPPSPTGKTPDFLFGTNGLAANGPRRAASSSTQMWSGRSQVLFDPDAFCYLPLWFHTLVRSIIVSFQYS